MADHRPPNEGGSFNRSQSEGGSFRRQRSVSTRITQRSVFAAADVAPSGGASATAATTKVIMITDPGQDLDDEMAFIMARHLVELGLLEVKAVVATLTPAFHRARLCRGTLDVLGMHEVRVGIGSDGGDTEGDHKDHFTATSASYIPRPFTESCSTLEPSQPLLDELYRNAADSELTLVIIASLKDAALFLRDYEQLFVAKTREELGVPLVIVSRHTAYAAKMPREVYDTLALSGSTIGWRLRNAQRASIEQLWQRACAPDGDAARKGLPSRCDRGWFIKTFCSGRDDPTRGGCDTVWDLVDGFMQYDTIALFAAVPALRDEYFVPRQVCGPHATSLLIGEEGAPGLSDPKGLVRMLEEGFAAGLACNHRPRTHVIVLVQLRWDNLTDVRLLMVTLRALWGVDKMDCVGFLITLDKSPSQLSEDEAAEVVTNLSRAPASADRLLRKGKSWKGGSVNIVPPGGGGAAVPDSPSKLRVELQGYAAEMAAMLTALGMSHVRVCVDDPEVGKSSAAVEHLHGLYMDAPPVGVTLVVTSTSTTAAAFAQEHPVLFRERTTRVVHMGGATVVAEKDAAGEPTGALELKPDPAAQNNRLDLAAARSLYETAQRLSVPMLVVSRHLANACSVPTALFDELEEFGGELGRLVKTELSGGFRELFTRACASTAHERRGLPERCTKAWFEATFCRGVEVRDADAVWPTLASVNIYNPLVLLAALPAVKARYLQEASVTIRSATHHVIGLSADDGSGLRPGMLGELRSLIYSCFFFGVTANASDYTLRDGLAARAKGVPIDHEEGSEANWIYEPPAALARLQHMLSLEGRPSSRE